jgi:hypothetical protein
MKLYHSSNVIVEFPDTLHSRNYLDFGRGFYLTSLYEQAVRYAQRFKRRGQQAWLNTYEFSIDDASQWKIMKFDSYDEQWLDFVSAHRNGTYNGETYDLIIGAVANDDVYRTLQVYSTGLLTKEQALEALKVKKLYNQYVFATEKALALLKFIEAKEV